MSQDYGLCVPYRLRSEPPPFAPPTLGTGSVSLNLRVSMIVSGPALQELTAVLFVTFLVQATEHRASPHAPPGSQLVCFGRGSRHEPPIKRNI